MNLLLKSFSDLPHTYVVLDTETTGLPDAEGNPGIVSLGIAKVDHGVITDTSEFKLKPYRPIKPEAEKIHGISNEQANFFDSIENKWCEIKAILDHNTIVIHNASFDWPILEFHIESLNLDALIDCTVFCSQKSSIAYAKHCGIPMSTRGPSLDSLTEYLKTESFRTKGIHGAEIDARQTALVVEALRSLADAE